MSIIKSIYSWHKINLDSEWMNPLNLFIILVCVPFLPILILFRTPFWYEGTFIWFYSIFLVAWGQLLFYVTEALTPLMRNSIDVHWAYAYAWMVLFIPLCFAGTISVFYGVGCFIFKVYYSIRFRPFTKGNE